MIIIAESGATKTDWRLITDDGQVRSASGPGLNPSVLEPEQINGIIGSVIPQLNPEGRTVSEVFFYGAGLVSPEAASPLEDALGRWCSFADVTFNTDMLAAARALFGDGSGIVAIMGTGSNSCLYQNGEIVRNIRPGGFILGDEGSGSALGKSFVSDFIKGLLPEHLEKDFKDRYGFDYQSVVRKVYREPGPSAFLASFAPYILERQDDEYMAGLLDECLDSFVKRSLSRYGAEENVGVVGSFGCACEAMLRQVGERYGLKFISFLKSPIDMLVKYHCSLEIGN